MPLNKKTIGAFFSSLPFRKVQKGEKQNPDSPFVPYYCLNCPPSLLPWRFPPSSFGNRSNTCKHTHTRAHAHGGVGGERLRACTADSDWSAGRKPLNAVFLSDLFKCGCASFSLFFCPVIFGVFFFNKKVHRLENGQISYLGKRWGNSQSFFFLPFNWHPQHGALQR